MPAKRRRKKKTAAPAAPAANATAAPAALPRCPDPASLDRDDRVEVSIEMKTLGNKFFAAKDFGECRKDSYKFMGFVQIPHKSLVQGGGFESEKGFESDSFHSRTP